MKCVSERGVGRLGKVDRAHDVSERCQAFAPPLRHRHDQHGIAGALCHLLRDGAGAEPLDNREHPLDREHYVEKQVRPVAEPVLETLGLDFERAIGDQRQADLF